MNSPILKIKVQLDDGAIMPAKAYDSDSGFDLFLKEDVSLPVGFYKCINTGVHLDLPKGWEGQIRPRSSSARRCLDIVFGTIDSGYTGAIGIFVKYEPSDYDMSVFGNTLHLKKGERITQLVLNRVPEVVLEMGKIEPKTTGRCDKGFGSTGV